MTYQITQEDLAKAGSDRNWRYPGVTEPGEYTWNEAQHRYEPVTTPMQTQTEKHPFDFDKGFGIGGLGRYVEDPPIPTIAQIERLEQMEAQATYCRRCGQSDVFDGAMFTTVGGNICDDCCG